MQTYRTPAAATAALTRAGFSRVAEVKGTDSVRYGFSRLVGGAVQSAVLTVFSADCATVRYL